MKCKIDKNKISKWRCKEGGAVFEYVQHFVNGLGWVVDKHLLKKAVNKNNPSNKK